MQGRLRGCEPDIHKVFSGGPVLYKIMQGPVTGFHQDLHFHKDLHKTSVKIFIFTGASKSEPWNSCKIVQKWDNRFVQACAVEMYVEMRQETFYARIYKKNAGAQDRDAQFVRSRAVEMHMDMWQEPCYARI